MKFFRLDLLTLLISLFILNSCKNPDGIGLDVDNGNQLNGTLEVDSNILLNTVKEDSVAVSVLARTPLAWFNDPVLGLTESSIATDINLPGLVKYEIPDGTITIDSAVMLMKYTTNGFYGDSLNSVFKVNVYQLNEKPISSTSNVYYNSKTWNYDNSTVVGSKIFKARLHDTTRITDIVDGKADTITRVLPQIRVPMDVNFIRRLLFTSELRTESNTAFQNYAKGLYITLDKDASTGPGGIMGFSTPDTIKVHVRINNDGEIDTAIVPILITRRFAQIKHTHTAEIEALIADQNTPNNTAYVQGLGGLRVKVNFPDLSKFKNVIINRAELVITPQAITPFAPLPRLMMYKLDLAKQRTYIEDAIDARTGFSTLFGGFYNVPIKNEYRFLLTSFVQNLVAGKTKDYGTYIGAANETGISNGTPSIDLNATAYPFGRTVLAGKNSPLRVKLNIIYTDIK
ncbi:MAG: DUF4270 family protein [Sphingobacteriaceae bacterium]|nr:MAG: DUF4270 family protein [Sphingobacteriaceae bacterium]